MTVARPLLLFTARSLLIVSGALFLTAPRTEVLAFSSSTLIIGTVLVSLLVVVLSIPHHGGMGDDARAEADGEDGSCRSGDGRALTPRGFLRCRLGGRGASCHGLVTRRVVDRRFRDGLQGRASKRVDCVFLSDGRHLCRFRLGHVSGQDFGLICALRLRLGQDRGALGVTCQVLVVVRHGGRSFLLKCSSLLRRLGATHKRTLWRNCENAMK